MGAGLFIWLTQETSFNNREDSDSGDLFSKAQATIKSNICDACDNYEPITDEIEANMQNNEREYGNMEISTQGRRRPTFLNSKETEIHEDLDN